MMISKKNCLGQQFAKILCETTICQKRPSGIVIYKVCKKKSNSEQHLQKGVNCNNLEQYHPEQQFA